ncbi:MULTISPECIES: ClpXP protease specificity-enhancing factor [Colwellia]|uniref:Stringent starvation protein B n=1 Tax=Colwellia marinimaniae TaxID=1513592 RepID=A0ABQ0MSG0_9GAMM|nr:MULTISPECIES: ClpXP protease specificity-enhancing factor [Colwellia]GAW94541.1 stringent starvation protein B [Colwellia marinimaniae]
MDDATPSSMSSNKPYLIKAFYEWISDNELTPYIMVDVNVYGVLVPMSYVADGKIVLNIASSAVGTISLGDKSIEFSARFGGILEHITVPYGAIGAIYAKENGAGTSLPIEHPAEGEEVVVEQVPEKPKSNLKSVASTGSKIDKSNRPKGKSKASLKIIK